MLSDRGQAGIRANCNAARGFEFDANRRREVRLSIVLRSERYIDELMDLIKLYAPGPEPVS